MRTSLIALGFVALGCQRAQPDAALDPAPTEVAVAIRVDPVLLLRALGTRLATDLTSRYPGFGVAVPASEHSDVLAIGTCTRPDAAERAAIAKVVSAGAFGCKEPTGIVVDAYDEQPNKPDGVWRILRVKNQKVTTLAQHRGVRMNDWMEWVDETALSTFALADVDSDGVRDIVMMRTRHEGGASRYEVSLEVLRSSDGKLGKLGELTGLLTIGVSRRTTPTELVIRWDDADEHTAHYKCVTGAALTDCPAAVEARRIDRTLEIADWFVRGHQYPPLASAIPDRDLLVGLLDIMQVRGADRDALLDAVPATTPAIRLRRELDETIAAWRAKPDDRAAQLASALGDAECTECPYKVVTKMTNVGREEVDRTDRLVYRGKTLFSVTARGPRLECEACGTYPPDAQFQIKTYRHGANVVAIVFRAQEDESYVSVKHASAVEDEMLHVFVDGKLAAKRPAKDSPWFHFDNGSQATALAIIDGEPFHWPDVSVAAARWLVDEQARADARRTLENYDPTRYDDPAYRTEIYRARGVAGL